MTEPVLQSDVSRRRFRVPDRLRSIRFAARGILVMIRSQHNAWLHSAATFCVLAAGVFLGVSSADWCWLIVAIAGVWTAEALNTAFERLADVVSPQFHPLVEQSKDVAAGAVLIAAIGASTIGLLILGPYVWPLVF